MTKNVEYTIHSHGKDIIIPPDQMVSLDNKPYIKFPGLMGAIEQVGIFSCKVEIVNASETEVIMKCIAKLRPFAQDMSLQEPCNDYIEEVEMYGSANTYNLRANMQKYMYEMANTRAVARALRVLLKCPYTAFEEMPPEAMDSKTRTSKVKKDSNDESLRCRYLSKVEEAMMTKEGVGAHVNQFISEHGYKVLQETSLEDAKQLYADCDKMIRNV